MIRARVESWWDGLRSEERVDVHAVALAGVVYLVHYAIFSWWYIEDAAISFAFARNAATWEGFVPTPGAERIEGFSNPTWTFALAALDVIGINPFIAAKLLGAMFGLLALWPTLRWARRVIPDGSPWPLVAPLLLALSPQFVLWNASGLENSFFVALLAIGTARMLDEVEGDRPGIPWSAVAFMLLAVTRPEAPMYAFAAAFGGFGLAMLRSPRMAIVWAAKWGVLFAAPFAAWHAWRFWYFAWEFPNTYYAKLDDVKRFQPYTWNVRGWKYLRGYALFSAQGFLLPFYAVGQTGLAGWRVVVAIVAVLCAGVLVLPGIEWLSSIPGWPLYETSPGEPWERARVGSLVACAIVLPLVGVGRPGHGARVMALGLAAITVFFALYSGGDWMKGHRWLSMAQPPIAILLADVAHSFASAVASHLGKGRLSRGIGGFVVAVPAVAGLVSSGIFISNPETMPYDVSRRVLYMKEVQRRMHLDHVTAMDVDMGAHMWWSGFDMVDMAGLVDVPMAQHKWEKPFIAKYVFEERRPEFAHVHGSWGTRTRIPKHNQWARDYVEIDGYPTGPSSQHPGNHVRRDLLVQPAWAGTRERTADTADGLRIVGLDVPSTTVGAGEALYIEIGASKLTETPPFRVLLFLAGPGGVVIRDLPPAYDWIPTADWKKEEVWIGRHAASLPADLAPGRYDLGLLVLAEGEKGGVMPIVASNGTLGGAKLAEGEVRWEGAIEVLAPEDARAEADRRLQSAIDQAATSCAIAEVFWSRARRVLGPDHPWQAEARRSIGSALAACEIRRAEALPATAAVDVVVAARAWDREHPDVLRHAATVADELEAKGQVAWEARDERAAYAAWRDALRLDPTRSHLRRRAEAARDITLRIEKWPAEPAAAEVEP